MTHELPPLPPVALRSEAWVDGKRWHDFWPEPHMRAYATSHAASLEAEVERLRAALRKADDALRIIGEQDPVENMLDPQWAARIAIATRAELP